MTWLHGGFYYLHTLEGYHVCRARVKGAWKYSAFAPKQHTPDYLGGEHLGCFDDAKSAKDCCEQHLGDA